jgi:hypothetical protein
MSCRKKIINIVKYLDVVDGKGNNGIKELVAMVSRWDSSARALEH